MTEGQKIYRAIFRGDIPPQLEERFHAVPDTVFPPISPDMAALYERIIRDVKDLEALELASRVRGLNLLLTLKFRLMVCLAECQPDCRPLLVNDRSRMLLPALIRIAVCGVRSIYKLAKGQFLLRSYHGN